MTVSELRSARNPDNTRRRVSGSDDSFKRETIRFRIIWGSKQSVCFCKSYSSYSSKNFNNMHLFIFKNIFKRFKSKKKKKVFVLLL